MQTDPIELVGEEVTAGPNGGRGWRRHKELADPAPFRGRCVELRGYGLGAIEKVQEKCVTRIAPRPRRSMLRERILQHASIYCVLPNSWKKCLLPQIWASSITNQREVPKNQSADI
jgi:hypothetical protein